MNSLIASVLLFAFVCSVVSAGPYFSPYYRPFGSLKSYYYGGVPPVAPVGAVAPVPAAAPSPVAPLLGDYYSYAAAAALSYPYGAAAALSYPYGYPYNYNYLGAYNGYPYLKK